MKYAPAGTETDLHCTRDDLTIRQLTNIASLGPRRMSPKVNQQVPLENELMTENRKEGDRPKFHHWAAEPRREFIKFQGNWVRLWSPTLHLSRKWNPAANQGPVAIITDD